MIPTLAMLTIRALLNRRRTLLLGLLGALIVVVAAVYRLGGAPEDEALEFTGRLLAADTAEASGALASYTDSSG